jgi:hypothetical protein
LDQGAGLIPEAAEKAEQLAALVELKPGEHFTRTRKRIRSALIEDGIAGKIETLVAALIGAVPMISIAPDFSESDSDDTDAD